MSQSSTFAETVAGLIADYLPTGHCSIKAIARHIGIHRTTLNRRLARANQNYLRLLHVTRVSRAAQLCWTSRPLADITRQLGFSDPSVFSRWFTTTFGCSATSWRDMQPGADEDFLG